MSVRVADDCLRGFIGISAGPHRWRQSWEGAVGLCVGTGLVCCVRSVFCEFWLVSDLNCMSYYIVLHVLRELKPARVSN